ncbi:MAG: tetratricopeptide repeat protein [Bacteroidales bacterium]|nr:tetratricopeptide repeat protein [Bacteroidales bacterium]
MKRLLLPGYYYRNLLICFLLVCFNYNINSQQDKANYVEITGVVEDNDYQPIAGVSIKLYENSQVIKTITTKSDGEFQFFVDYNKYYIVELSKAGMVTKKIAYDTKLPEGSKGVWGVGFPISLFEGCPGVETSVMNDPIGLIKYNERKRELEGDEDYRQKMQAKIGKLMMDIEDCKRKAYNENIKEADNAYKQKDYEKAKESYEEALKQNPDDSYATKKLEEINQIIAKDEQTKKLYDVNINEGDKYFDSGNLTLAKSFYQRSLTYDKNAEYPKNKIAEIERLLTQQENKNVQDAQQVEQKAKEEAYNKLIAEADKLYNAQDFDGAKNLYNQAQELQPTNPYPKTKITEIDLNKKKREEEEANQRAIDYAYKNAILEGDNNMNIKKYEDAKTSYQKALTYRPDAEYPKTKIAEIEQILAQQRYHKNQEDEKEQQYRNALAEADQYMQAQNYQAAKSAYQKALSIKPDESYPRTKIAEADKQISEYQRQMAQDQAKEQAYKNAIAEGDQYMQAQNYPAARAAYQKAQTFKPNDSYAKSRIDEVDRAISARQQQQAQEQAKEQAYKNAIAEGDQYMLAKNYTAAKAAYQKAASLKPDESYPRNRIAEADKQITEQQRQMAQDQAKEQAYNNAIAEGDQFLRDENYTAAKAAYQKALTYKPTESYPKTKIAEVDRIVSEHQQQLAQEQAKEQAYKSAIAEADQYFQAKNYTAAKASYLKALNIKPNENYPHDKIDEIDKIVIQQQQQLAQEQAKEQAYKTAIAEADQYLNNKNYNVAKAAYQKALTYKPNESYPQTKIAEIDRIVAQQQQQLAQEQAKEQAFKSALAEGDQYFNAKNYPAAKAAYQKALTYKPSENYPQSKIAEIDRIVTQQQQQLAQEQAKEKQYNDAVAEADKFFQAGNYTGAKSAYQKALGIKPGSAYPTNKIKEIDAKLAQQQTDKDYQNAINLADNYMKQNNLEAAKTEYEKASRLKTNENYPKTKIEEINNLIAQAAKAEQEEKQKKNEFDRFINLADTYFNKKDYKNAKDNYNKALAIFPNAPHPSQRINEIDKILSGQTSAPPTVKKGGEIADLKFNNKDEEAKYLTELKNKYPEGVTLEIYKSARRTVNRYIVIREGVANEYRKIQYSWGAEYSVNGRDITDQYFKQQTEIREGEYYKAFEIEN